MYKSVDEALTRSFAIIRKDIVKLSSLNSMAGRASYGELTPQERHAQAAMVIGYTERTLSDILKSYAKCKYQHDFRNALIIVEYLKADGDKPEALAECLKIYCGKRGGCHTVRKILACKTTRAVEFARDKFGKLDCLHYRMITELEPGMIKNGWITP